MPVGFTPINTPKRTLTPNSSAAISTPLKRLAVDGAPRLANRPGQPVTCQNLPDALPTIDANPEAQFPPQEPVKTPPSRLEEVPETPDSSLLSRPHIAVVGSDEADSWMNEFVNLDQAGNEGFVTVKDSTDGSFDATSETLSNTDAGTGKPFPELDLAPVPSKIEPPVEDAYSFDDSDEEEMIQLLENTDVSPSRIPPSSVIQKLDHDSRSATSFDSELQFSSPGKSNYETTEAAFAEPDLLDEEVDWDLVAAYATKATSSLKANPVPSDARTPNKQSSQVPIVRPPFPVKVKDRSVVVGFSSKTMMRTCFRIGELLNTSAKCAREKQDVFLELFARVIYSSRENAARVQHFQLRDLFTDRQPFLSGVFKDWKSGGPVDQQSSVFLGPRGKDKLCRCLCKLIDDKKAVIGRSAMILSIRETTWDEVQWALRVVVRDAAAEEEGHNEGLIYSST